MKRVGKDQSMPQMMPGKWLWWWHRYQTGKREESSLHTSRCQEIHAAKVKEEKHEVNYSEDQIWEVQTNKHCTV